MNKFKQNGFTLIEIAVVSLLLAMLTAVIYNTMKGIIRSKDATVHLRETDQVAQFILAKFNSELSSKASIPLNRQKDENPDNEVPPPNLQPQYFLGTNKKSGASDRDSLRFVTSNAAQPFNSGFGNHGAVEIEYRVEENKEDVQDSFADKQSLLLIREEIPATVDSNQIIKAKRVVFPLAENLTSLNFRYLNNGAWTNEWRITSPSLPEAVEISFKLKDSLGNEEEYKTSIPMRKKVPNLNPQ